MICLGGLFLRISLRERKDIFLVGRLEEHKVKLDAEEFDIIHSEHEIEYELDSWFGILVDADTIVGVSKDGQGIEGKFTFTREKN